MFYYRKWANFKEAKIGSFNLIPNNEYLKKLKEDYELMRKMIYGADKEITFDDIINVIKMIEEELNNYNFKENN